MGRCALLQACWSLEGKPGTRRCHQDGHSGCQGLGLSFIRFANLFTGAARKGGHSQPAEDAVGWNGADRGPISLHVWLQEKQEGREGERREGNLGRKQKYGALCARC